jgi:hypothetical protein
MPNLGSADGVLVWMAVAMKYGRVSARINGAPSAHPKAEQRESKLVGEVGVFTKALQQRTGLVSTARFPDPGPAHNFGLHPWIGDGRGE